MLFDGYESTTRRTDLAERVQEGLIARGLASHEEPIVYYLLYPGITEPQRQVFQGIRQDDGSLITRSSQRGSFLKSVGVDPTDDPWASANWTPDSGWQVCGTCPDMKAQLLDLTSTLPKR